MPRSRDAAAARSMLGSTTPYGYIHSFWSDQYEHKLRYVGTPRVGRVRRARELAGTKTGWLYLRDGLLQAPSAWTVWG